MAAGIIVLPQYMPVRDRNGRLVSGALMGVYVNRTTTKTAVYSDSSLSTPLANPVVADSSGRFPIMWTEAGTIEEPVQITLSVSGPGGISIGNPAVFHDWQASLDADVATIALAMGAQADADAAEAAAAVAVAALAEIEDIAATAPEFPAIVNKLDRDGGNIGGDLEDFQIATGISDKEDRLGGVLNSRVRASVLIDDTSRLQDELDAGYDKIILPAGTIWIDDFEGPDGVWLQGQGAGRTIIKRRPGSTSTTLAHFSGKRGFKITDLTLDGNRDNCALPSSNLVIETGCYDFEIANVETIEAKAVSSSYGGGITVLNTADAFYDTFSTVRDCFARDNDTFGMSALIVQNFSFFRCRATGHAANSGINVDNFALPVPGFPTQINVSVSECTTWRNAGGISMFGLRSGVSALGDIASQDNYVTRSVRVCGNTIFENTGHGLQIQADGVVCSGNEIYRNGSSMSNGGVLFNSRRSVLTGNNIYENYYYGVDAGGARDTIIANNQITRCGMYDAGSGAANQCIALNLGATIGVQVHDNHFAENGGDGTGGGCYSIFASNYDGASDTNWLRWSGRDLSIRDNNFTLTDPNHQAISIRNGFQQGVSIFGNTAYCDGITSTLVYDLAASGFGFSHGDNRIRKADYSFGDTLASATSLTANDNVEVINITGTTAITSLLSHAQSYYADKVRFVPMTNGGSGYTSVPTVSFTGGGGSGAVGIACLGADGVIYGVYVTVPGSGYTSAPTVGFSGGGGSGATATAAIGCNNWDDKIITLRFENAASVNSGGNILLAGGNFTASGSGISTLTLRGAFGNLYEVSRAA